MPSILDSISPLVDRVRNVRPGAAKESATRSAATTKDIVALSIGYVKQETKQPLQGLVRFLQFGLPAAMFIATGLVLSLLGVLRGFQAAFAYERVKQKNGLPVLDKGVFAGGWSWVPYLLTTLVCLLALGLIGIAARGALRSSSHDRNSEGMR